VGCVWPRHCGGGRPLNSVVSCHLKRLLNSTIVAIGTSATVLAFADTRVTISPPEQVITSGETPLFTVRVEAVERSARIIRFAGRDDLRVNYARLIVSQANKSIGLAPAISDPGPIGDADVISLNPGESISFIHRGEPFPLRELSPGKYSAKVLFDSTLVGGDRVESNVVMLRVMAK
jgi:hypothetical protein